MPSRVGGTNRPRYDAIEYLVELLSGSYGYKREQIAKIVTATFHYLSDEIGKNMEGQDRFRCICRYIAEREYATGDYWDYLGAKGNGRYSYSKYSRDGKKLKIRFATLKR